MPHILYEPVIGLEIHVQLHTKSKLFCGCSTAAASVRDVAPNTHICPICTGHPGVLPRPINRRAVMLALRLASACHSEINASSDFDRKNYFYADLPKGYQITQHRRALATGGWLDMDSGDGYKRIYLDHMHIEEDPGKSKVDGGVWLVDMNRCGVPLVEIVTRPDLRSAAEAAGFMSAFRRIVRYLGVSEGNMEMGNMRCDANVSMRPAGSDRLGTKTEIKNLNSFRFLQEAINWEIERQTRELKNGGTIRQVTIHWDERQGEGRLSREKETEADYRYFREPNLIPVVITEALQGEAGEDMAELPIDRFRRYVQEYGLSARDAETLVEEQSISDYFEEVVAAYEGPPRRAADWVRNHVLRTINDPSGPSRDIRMLPMTPVYLSELLNMVDSKVISDAMAPQVFEKVIHTGESPRSVVEKEGLRPPDEDDVVKIIQQVIEEDPESVQAYRNGNEKVLNRLVGHAMRMTKGRADARRVRELLLERVEG